MCKCIALLDRVGFVFVLRPVALSSIGRFSVVFAAWINGVLLNSNTMQVVHKLSELHLAVASCNPFGFDVLYKHLPVNM